ncbi:MAG: hypothetical protein IAF38_00585 [Bacteroidia bacterium]|nr:hypothetical protein [Bacteroidia bacterium]
MNGNQKNLTLSFVYFTLSTAITWWFIKVCPLYISREQMLLSCGVAGGKWGIQLIAGFFLLKEKKWEFFRRIGFTCLMGSVVLIPYCAGRLFFKFSAGNFFLFSIMIAVILMIPMYFFSVKKCGISIKWWFGWLFCLATAISLQLTAVFHVI